MALSPSEMHLSLRRRYRLQKSLRAPLDPVLDEINYYTGPVRAAAGGATAGTTGSEQSAQQPRTDLWDFTAIDGREKLAASMQGSMTNPALRWIVAAWRSIELNRDSDSSKWLADRCEEVWGDIQDSDFNTEIGCAFLELTGPGHTFVGMEPLDPLIVEVPDKRGRKVLKEEWAGVDFTAIPLEDSYFEQDRRGGIRTFWRRYRWQPSQIVDYCEDKGIPVPEKIMEAYTQGTGKEWEVVCAFYLRSEIAKRKKVQYPAAPEKRPWGVMWWIENDGSMLGEDGGYYEQPVFMCRWSKTAGSKWGHGPANVALPTVKYVNQHKEMVRVAEEKSLDPPVFTKERNIIGGLKGKAGGVTICRDPEQIKVFESKARVDVGEKVLELDRAEIRKIFHTDDLELKDSPAMTATEAQIRYEWMQRLLGKTVTFIQNDLLGPIISNLIAMRMRLGAAPPMPRKARDAGGIFNIEFQGPLARSMRTDEVAAIERGATFVAGLAQFYPEVRAAFDPVKAIRYVFQRLGVPADLIPSDAEITKGMKEMKQMQARMAGAEVAKNEGAAMKSRADASKSGGPVQGAVYPALPPQPPMGLDGQVARG